MILETPKVWLDVDACLAKTFSDDDDVVARAKAEGRGILYLTPHLGCFEITARYIAQHSPITVMYSPAVDTVEPVMAQAREIPGLTAVPANMNGVRQFVRALRRGESVGMLPDQVPRGGEGIWTPFFERPAYTMTLAAKLAVQTGVAVILTAGERLPNGKGWRIHYVRLPEPLANDVNDLVPAINQAMEALIRRFPEQYLWSYSRYKRPDGAPPRPDFPVSQMMNKDTLLRALFRYFGRASFACGGVGPRYWVGWRRGCCARARIVRTNLRLAFPQLSEREREAMLASPFPPVGAISRGPRPAMVWPCLHHHERHAHTGLGTPGRPAGPATPHYFVGPALHRA